MFHCQKYCDDLAPTLDLPYSDVTGLQEVKDVPGQLPLKCASAQSLNTFNVAWIPVTKSVHDRLYVPYIDVHYYFVQK